MTRYASRTDSTHKYRAKPTVVDGVKFHSQKEARRYQELKLLEKAGEIEDLELQTRFPIHVTTNDGEREYICDYVADFVYWDTRRKSNIIEDVKGFRTPVYRLKKKMVQAEHGFIITEV